MEIGKLPKLLMDLLTEQEKKLLKMRAEKISWKLIAKEFNCHRSTAWSKWQRALAKLSSIKSRS